jgi:hypothetical protein
MRRFAPVRSNSPALLLGGRAAGGGRRLTRRLARCGGLLAADVVDRFLGSGTADSVGFALGGVPPARWLSCRTTSAVPPMPNNTGHSTKPAAPIAPRVSMAAGVEWLPLLTPFLMPFAVPCSPPITPLTAAPPTAPAAAVAASADRATTRAAPRNMFIIQHLHMAHSPAVYLCEQEYPR